MTDESVVISAPRMWDGLAGHDDKSITIVVTGDVITEVGNHVSAPSSARKVDLPDQTVLPGLIDTHVHVAARPADGPRSAGTVVSRRVLGAVPALKALLHNGFTTVRDLGASTEEPVTVSLRDAVAAGVLAGPQMIVAPHIVSSRAGHGDETTGLSSGESVEQGAVADGVERVLVRVREEVRAGADWVKFAASGGFTSLADSPEDVTYTQEEMDALVTAAADFNRPCAAHAIGDLAIRRAVAAGVRSVEHGSLVSAETLSLLAKQDTFLVPTLYAVLYHLEHLDDDDFWRTHPVELREKMVRHADPMLRAIRRIARSDVRIAFGTDAGMFPYEDNWREFVTMVDNGFSPARALRAATSAAADLLMLQDRGHLRPRCRADLIAVQGNPLDDITAMGRVTFVMQGGRIVKSAAEPG